MFKKEYKNDFNSITPDINLIEETLQKINNSPKRHLRMKFVAAAMSICFLIVGGFMASNLNKSTFSLVAFADDDSQYINIEENTQMVMPFGKISIGNQDFYIDETGNKVYTYDVGFDSGGISIKGKDIVKVKYTSMLGELMFFDSAPNLIQQGKEITTIFYEELGDKSFTVYWNPWHAINIISKDGSANYQDLSKDNIEITVFFANGKSITKNLQLFFDRDGNLIAEITKVPLEIK